MSPYMEKGVSKLNVHTKLRYVEVKQPGTNGSKNAAQIANELEAEGRRLIEISHALKGRKKPGRKPKGAVEYVRMGAPRKAK